MPYKEIDRIQSKEKESTVAPDDYKRVDLKKLVSKMDKQEALIEKLMERVDTLRSDY